MRWISSISSGHSIQMQKNTPSTQVHMEHPPGQATSWVIKQTSVKLTKLKLYQASSLTTTLLNQMSIRRKTKTVRNTNTRRLINTFLNNQQVSEEIKGEIKKSLETNDNENTTTQKSKNHSNREVYNDTPLPQETRKTSNRQLKFTPKTTGKGRTKKPPKLVEGKKS